MNKTLAIIFGWMEEKGVDGVQHGNDEQNVHGEGTYTAQYGLRQHAAPVQHFDSFTIYMLSPSPSL